MDATNEDVGHSALPCHLVQSLLDVVTVGLLVQLVGRVLGVELAQDALRVVAVRAVGFAKDHCYTSLASRALFRDVAKESGRKLTDGIVVNQLLSFLLSGFHCECGRGSKQSAKDEGHGSWMRGRLLMSLKKCGLCRLEMYVPSKLG
jgi:hypothetical protein